MKRSRLVHTAMFLLVVIFLAAIYVVGNQHLHENPPPVNHPKQAATQAAPKASPLAHVFIVVMENKEYSAIINNSQAPYINSLAQTYATATNYSGVAHPSEPNYLALTSGSTDGVTTDCNPPSAGCEVSVPNIADEIEKSGRTWKEYAESMPTACYTQNAGEYATKHNPFVYYNDVVNNSARCKAHVVPFTQLATDLASVATTPNYAFITPNLCNDMHDCSVSTGNNWLAAHVPMILNSKAFTTQSSLLVITWDEGSSASNHVPTILIGSSVKRGYQSVKPYNHYSLLHTIEYRWGLPPLTNNDKSAPLMNEFFVSP